MSALAVRLLGRFRILVDGSPLDGLDHRAGELIAILLVERHAQRRESVGARLWPEESPTLARKSIRQGIWRIQSALRARGPDTDMLLVSDGDWLVASPDAWVDLHELEAAYAAVSRVAAGRLDPALAASLARATSLYDGELLEGWDADWCRDERDRAQGWFFGIMDRLIAHEQAGGRYDCAIALGDRVLRLDRARERTHRDLMRLHYLAGDRTAALRQHERCVEALDTELGVRPSRRTDDLFRRIHAGEAESELATLDGGGSPSALARSSGAAPDAGAIDVRDLQAQVDRLERRLESVRSTAVATLEQTPVRRPPA
jgi:DNA-binding SARP family transcriptional activator